MALKTMEKAQKTINKLRKIDNWKPLKSLEKWNEKVEDAAFLLFFTKILRGRLFRKHAITFKYVFKFIL